jgi:hypothetical protein
MKVLYADTSAWSGIVDRRDPERMLLSERFMFRVRRKATFIISKIVRAEIQAYGNHEARLQMMRLLDRFRVLVRPAVKGVQRLADDLLASGCLGSEHQADLLHLASAVYWDADYMVTWDVGDQASVQTRNIVARLCRMRGRSPLRIGTLQEVAQWLDVRIR